MTNPSSILSTLLRTIFIGLPALSADLGTLARAVGQTGRPIRV